MDCLQGTSANNYDSIQNKKELGTKRLPWLHKQLIYAKWNVILWAKVSFDGIIKNATPSFY